MNGAADGHGLQSPGGLMIRISDFFGQSLKVSFFSMTALGNGQTLPTVLVLQPSQPFKILAAPVKDTGAPS